MLFEHVSDRGFRSKYRASGGFCPVHAKHLDSFRDGLAVAILGSDILSDILPRLNTRKISKTKALCPACEESYRIEAEFLSLLASISDESFIGFFTASDGLCIPHYQIMVNLNKSVVPWLKDFQQTKFETLLARTRNFIECSAWGRQDDFDKLSEKDKIVWKEIAFALRGNKD